MCAHSSVSFETSRGSILCTIYAALCFETTVRSTVVQVLNTEQVRKKRNGKRSLERKNAEKAEKEPQSKVRPLS